MNYNTKLRIISKIGILMIFIGDLPVNKNIGKNYKNILTENNLEKYIELFENNNLTDIMIISELEETDLEKLGIDKMGDRKKILKLFISNW